MKSLSFGKLPNQAEFTARFEDYVKSGEYSIGLSREDRELASRVGLDGDLSLEDTHDAHTLFECLKVLTKAWDHNGDEKAGLFASDILTTLDIEWI